MPHTHSDRPLLYVLNDDWIYSTGILGHTFENEIIRICPTGIVVVKKGMRSDGCTPKWRFGHMRPIGIPDGYIVDAKGAKQDGYPITARAFFLHDALLDTHHETGISTKKINAEFCNEINEADFRPKWFYCRAVQLFGPRS